MRKLLNIMESAIIEDSFDLEKYASDTPGYVNVYKGIPIKFRDHEDVLDAIKDKKLRVRYRGPSSPDYQRPQSHMIRDHATSFALYPKKRVDHTIHADGLEDAEYRQQYINHLNNILDSDKHDAIKKKAQEILDKIDSVYNNS